MGQWRRRRYHLVLVVVAAWVLVAAQAGRAAEEILTNELVVKMVKAGLSESVIVAKIQSSASEFDTRTDTLLTLKQAGVSDGVLEAMIRASRRAIVQEKPTSQPATSVARERKKVERTPVAALGNELQRLNDLKAQGQITEEKYALLRKRLIETYPVGRGLGRVATAPSKQPVGVTGVWKGEWSTREGDLSGTLVLDLNQEGTKVTGIVGLEVPYLDSYGVDYAEERIRNGKIQGRILTFEVPWATQGMRGRLVVKGSSMRGTLENIPASIVTEEVSLGEAVLRRE